jgi:hypothetical protein
MSPNDNRGKQKSLYDPSGTSKHPKSRLVGMLPAVARTVITQYDHFDGLLQQAVHLLPAKVFTEDYPTKAALKRRVSSLETVSHDLFEENQDLQESLEGEAKKRAKEVKKFQNIFFNLSHIDTPRQRGMRLPRRSALRMLGDDHLSQGPTTTE